MDREMIRRADRRWKLFVFTMVVVAGILIFALRVSGQAERGGNTEPAEAFRRNAPAVVLAFCEQKYFGNCGVMLTSAFEGGCVQEFRIRINHENFSALSEIGKQVFVADLTRRLQNTWTESVSDMGDAESEVTMPVISVILDEAGEE
ncbi:MAG: hypothetical protein IJU25_02330 [Lachnospiraceae bacterium]|nr:hypothetical protein [Lachnospiraceae bacterium]